MLVVRPDHDEVLDLAVVAGGIVDLEALFEEIVPAFEGYEVRIRSEAPVIDPWLLVLHEHHARLSLGQGAIDILHGLGADGHHSVQSGDVEVVDRLLDHHVWSEDGFPFSSDLENGVASVILQYGSVPRVLGDQEQMIGGTDCFGDVRAHERARNLAGACMALENVANHPDALVRSATMKGVQPRPPQPLSDSGALIVGGTSGIGYAAARAFVMAGTKKVLLVGRDERRGVAVCDELSGLSRTEVYFITADVTAVEGALLVATEAQRQLGRIDVLVNASAAPHLPTLLHDTPIESMSRILTDIALPQFLVTRAVLPLMRAQSSGCIINVASDAAKVATPGESVIGAAMAAIVVFTRTLAMEAKRDGVRVNVLTPSLVAGTGTAERLFADTFSAKLFGKALALAQLGVSTADDQAALILFLAGPHGQRITGQAISVNGGISSA